MDIQFLIYEDHLENDKKFSQHLKNVDCGYIVFDYKNSEFIEKEVVNTKNNDYFHVPIGTLKFLNYVGGFYKPTMKEVFDLNFDGSHPKEYLQYFTREQLFNHDYDIRLIHDVPKEKVFLRPFTNVKTFTGQVVDFSSLLNESIFRKTYNIQNTDLVMVSSPKTILKEYRFFVFNGIVLDYSEYKWGDLKPIVSLSPDINPIFYENEAKKVAEKFAKYKLFQNYSLLTIDLGLTINGDIKLMEINPGVTSGFYDCSKNTIFKEIVKQFKDVHNILDII
jgi:hypothetical protein